jgi:hypothetical protein
MTTQDVAAQLGSSIDCRLGCSTISFRAWTLPGALADISGQGVGEIDLGALPGVCDHVPTPLPPELVDVLADQILASDAIATVARTLTAAAEFVGRFGDHIAHVHIRDAVPGNINLSVGNGQVDFAHGLKALADARYAGHSPSSWRPTASPTASGRRPPLAPLDCFPDSSRHNK